MPGLGPQQGEIVQEAGSVMRDGVEFIMLDGGNFLPVTTESHVPLLERVGDGLELYSHKGYLRGSRESQHGRENLTEEREGLYEVRKYHRYRECSIGSPLFRVAKWMAPSCFVLGMLGIYAASLGPCDGFDSPSYFCLSSGGAYVIFGCWFMITELLKGELQTGWRALHLTASAAWVLQWGIEIVWGTALLTGFGGHQSYFDPTLFVHSDKPCAHRQQEMYIITAFGLALIKSIVEKISLRFDVSTTEYRQSFRYVERPVTSLGSTTTNPDDHHAHLYNARFNAGHSTAQVECLLTGKVFASAADFQLHCNRLTREEMLESEDDRAEADYTCFHVYQPLFSRVWFGALCLFDSALVSGLTLCNIGDKGETREIVANIGVAIWFLLLGVYTLWLSRASWSHYSRARISELERESGLICGGWWHTVAALVSLCLVCITVANMRFVTFKLNGRAAFLASWLAIVLSLLQLMFTRVNVVGLQGASSHAYKLLRPNDEGLSPMG